MDKLETLTTPLLQKHAELVNDGQPSKPPSLEQMNRAAFSKGNLTPSHFIRLWQRMAETFGHQWTSSFGTEPCQAWVDGLADMTVDDIKTGLGNLKSWKTEGGWPPNMLQFRELCRPHSAPAHTEYVPLPAPKSSWEQRQHAAENSFGELRGGALKPTQQERKSELSDEDRANLERLDWERIEAAADGDYVRLNEIPKTNDANAPMPSEAEACTCQLEKFGTNDWRAVGPVCDYCLEWNRKITEAGIGSKPMRPVQQPKRRRKAA